MAEESSSSHPLQSPPSPATVGRKRVATDIQRFDSLDDITRPLTPSGLGALEEDAPLLRNNSDGSQGPNYDSSEEDEEYTQTDGRGRRKRTIYNVHRWLPSSLALSAKRTLPYVYRVKRNVTGSRWGRVLIRVLLGLLVFLVFFAMLAVPWKSQNPLLSNEPPSSFPSEGIRMLTYNFYLRPPPIQSIPATDYKDARLDLFINNWNGSSVLDRYDIFAFAECFGTFTNRRDRLIAAAEERGLKYAVHGPERNWWKGHFVDSGLLVLSKYPIAKYEMIEFKRGKGSDSLASKGILYVQILLSENSRLHLFVTHLQSTYVPDEEDDGDDLTERGAQVRAKQLKTLERFVKRTVKKARSEDNSRDKYTHDTIVLAGDFNVPGSRFGWQEDVDSKQYLQMVQTLQGQEDEEDHPKRKIYDILRRVSGLKHPITYNPWETLLSANQVGGGNVVSSDGETVGEKAAAVGEVVSAGEEGNPIGKRLDYVFEWRGLCPSDSAECLRLTTASVEPFRVADKEFLQLSDHRGVETLLKYEENEDRDVLI